MSEERGVARRAGTVGAATLLSRVLGLAREQVVAGCFGAGLATDALIAASRIPNLLRELFAEGAMSPAFVPVFTETFERRGEAAAWALGRRMLTALGLVMLAVAVAGWIAAPALVRAFTPGFAATPGKLELTTRLARVLMPALPFAVMGAACAGMLNARGKFAEPALAASLPNVGVIVIGLALIPVCRAFGAPPILAMAFGAVAGALLQFAAQLVPLGRLGFRWGRGRPGADPSRGVHRVVSRMLPAAAGHAATQLNVLVGTLLASLLPQGSVSWLSYAFRLVQLPAGVFGAALATVSLPALARAAVAGDDLALRRTLSASVRLGIVLTVPAMLWLAVMAEPVVALLFEHGHFHAADTTRAAGALMMYSGLPAFAAIGVFARTFYALGDTGTPVRASFIALAVNLALNLLLMQPLAHLGLALATSVTAIVHLAVLAVSLRRRIGRIDGGRIGLTLLRSAAAGGLGATACAAGLWISRARWHHGFVAEAGTVFGALAVATAITAAVMRLLRVEESAVLEDLARSTMNRLRRR